MLRGAEEVRHFDREVELLLDVYGVFLACPLGQSEPKYTLLWPEWALSVMVSPSMCDDPFTMYCSPAAANGLIT